MKINKFIYITLLILLISSCSSTAPIKENACSIKTGISYYEGKIGIRVQDRFNSGKFQISFVKDYFKITINGPLGFGTKVIEKSPFGLSVDKKEQDLDFNNWMLKEYGWNFPIDKLPEIVLTDNGITKPSLINWSVQVLKRQGLCKHSRLIRLTHRSKDIQVKLVITTIRLD
jgi:outer membrane biogenesis lipoprotein LolB